MKKQIIVGITAIACVALCAAVWSRSAEVGDLPAELDKTAVTAKIEAQSEGTPQILFSAVTPAPESEATTETEPKGIEITTEKETETTKLSELPPRAVSKSAPASTEPKSGDRAVIDSKPHIWIPGFGWIVDEGGGSVGTTVGNPGDELTVNKVGIIGGGTTVHGKGDINKQVGIMGSGDECPSSAPTAPPTE